MLSKREFHYIISWKNLRKIGIEVSDVLKTVLNKAQKEPIIAVLKANMPEMLRLTGYNIDKTPQLSLDYFQTYCIHVFCIGSPIECRPKPSGRYLYSEEGFRVLVDENNMPMSNTRNL